MEFTYTIPIFLFSFLIVEVLLKRSRFLESDWQNNLIDLWALLQATVVIGPFIAYGSALAAGYLFPEYENALITTPYWLQFIALLLLEDMVQYWWHRSAHSFKVLWPLHRVHHAAPYLGIKIWLRNGLFYVWLMPNLWFASVLIYLGFGKVYLAYSALKMLVSGAAHSEIRWDRFLYRYRWLHPVAWIIERTISTPATHFSHHALNEDDGIGHFNGNFGNLLFFWDVLFGTALITRRYPPAFGLQEDRQLGIEHWYIQLLYPLFRSRRKTFTNASQSFAKPAELAEEI